MYGLYISDRVNLLVTASLCYFVLPHFIKETHNIYFINFYFYHFYQKILFLLKY